MPVEQIAGQYQMFGAISEQVAVAHEHDEPNIKVKQGGDGKDGA